MQSAFYRLACPYDIYIYHPLLLFHLFYWHFYFFTIYFYSILFLFFVKTIVCTPEPFVHNSHTSFFVEAHRDTAERSRGKRRNFPLDLVGTTRSDQRVTTTGLLLVNFSSKKKTRFCSGFLDVARDKKLGIHQQLQELRSALLREQERL